jgi:hypothetical protein
MTVGEIEALMRFLRAMIGRVRHAPRVPGGTRAGEVLRVWRRAVEVYLRSFALPGT